ncbi:hypothetical protein [Actinomycetospora soli]|uniref:hypothetical protein n=1 Tax=Actinomycetospora soli TaxID=2893887 RepID=UPI001E5A4792|nr:hypothetical protein [Actinomycetospora soli]MCD2187974.1 hypothetical protein [Actinomycetospora soli]
MSAGEFARDESAGNDDVRRRPRSPLERVPHDRFVVEGTRGLRWRARWWLLTCSPTSRPWSAFALCLLGIVGMFLPVARDENGAALSMLTLVDGPAILLLVAFGVLSLLPVVDLVLGRERLTPWLAFPAALGMQVTLALALVAGSQGAGALDPQLSAGVSGPGSGVLVLGGVELGLAVIGALGFVRRSTQRRYGLA